MTNFDELSVPERKRLSKEAFVRQYNNRRGVCNGCGRAFSGWTAFDLHQTSINEYPHYMCMHPSDVVAQDGSQKLVVKEEREVDGISVPLYGNPESEIHPWQNTEALADAVLHEPAGVSFLEPGVDPTQR